LNSFKLLYRSIYLIYSATLFNAKKTGEKEKEALENSFLKKIKVIFVFLFVFWLF